MGSARASCKTFFAFSFFFFSWHGSCPLVSGRTLGVSARWIRAGLYRRDGYRMRQGWACARVGAAGPSRIQYLDTRTHTYDTCEKKKKRIKKTWPPYQKNGYALHQKKRYEKKRIEKTDSRDEKKEQKKGEPFGPPCFSWRRSLVRRYQSNPLSSYRLKAR